MSGSRFLKDQLPFLMALTLLAACKASPGVGAEPLSTVPAASTAVPDKSAERHVVINIPSRTLWVYSGDRIIRYFPVGVGRVGYMTPLGKFSVIRKVLDPGWENPYLPTGKVRLAPGEDNPLGTRWMGFYQKEGGEYGLHGTDNPGSVGKFSSHGCVRMKVPDAEALFDMVDVGTPVEVVYEPVLIRRQDDNIRVIVYADRFKRGMPGVEQVKADILKQYPSAQLNLDKLKAALQMPTERPVDVGTIPHEEQAAGATEAQKSLAPTQALNPDPNKLVEQQAPDQKAAAAEPVGVQTDWKANEPQTAQHPQNPVREPASSTTPLPLNPQHLFNSETTRL